MSETRSSTDETISTTTGGAKGRDWGSLLASLVAALTLIALAWMETVAWQKLSVAEQTIERAHSASLSSGVELQEGLGALKLSLLLAQISGEDSNRETFNAQARQFSALIAESSAGASSDQERVLVRETDQSIKNLLAASESFEAVKAIRRGTVERLTADLEKLLEPAYAATAALVKLQSGTRSRLQTESADAFATARRALRMSLVALVILLGAIAFLMHRSFLLPLKARLLAAAAESERHEKMASLGVLATGVAHEIRNPLTAIKFRLFSLKKSLGEDLATNEDYQTIRNEIDRLETLVKNFLEFARPDDPNFSRIVPSELLRDVERLLEPELTRKKITLQLDVADELDFQGDRQQLRQVLINLVQNAADSMQQGGTITLRAHAGSAGFREGRGAAVLLEVIDTGAGIDAEVQKRIFDPFFSTKEGGTGLGLAIASRIVEQHGGMLQVSTRKDHGSTFTLVLPAVQSTTTH